MAFNPELQQGLRNIIKGALFFDEPMSKHTAIKIGGPADVWAEPVDIDDLETVIEWASAHDLPYIVFGNGSNTLVRDGGIRGIVLSLARFNAVRTPDDDARVVVSSCRRVVETAERPHDNTSTRLIYAESGVLLPHLLSWALENGLSGLEPLVGIPAALGGAIAMNAGTKHGSIGDVVEEITVLDSATKVQSSKHALSSVEGFKVQNLPREKLEFKYRGLKLGSRQIILSALLNLEPKERHEIEAKMKSLRDERSKTQPLLWPSLGSVFKNPERGPKAWKLIDEAGLRGVRIGGARISQEHANWIINEGKAAAKDVEKLIHLIRDKVKEESGVLLETEVGVVGE